MPERKKISEKKDKRRRGKVIIPGVEKPVYVSGKTQREVEENKRKVREEFIHGVRVKDRPFVELIVDWFNTVKKPKIKTTSTLNNWRTTLNHHVLPCFNTKKLTSAVSRADLQRCLDKLEGMNRCVAIQAHSTLKGACQLALAEGIIIRDPSLLLNRPSPKNTKSKDSLTIEQEKVLLEEASHSEYGVFLYLLYYTGCRKGEVLGLQWGDINWESKTVHIVRNIDLATNKDDQRHVGNLKTVASDRIVPIPQALIDILKPMKGLDHNYITSNSSTPLTAAQCAHRWNTMMLDCGYARYNDKHTSRSGNVRGIDNDITPHHLRHHYVTSCVIAGLRPEVVMMIVGHSDYHTTLSVYTHLMHDGEVKKTMLSELIKCEVAERLPVELQMAQLLKQYKGK